MFTTILFWALIIMSALVMVWRSLESMAVFSLTERWVKTPQCFVAKIESDIHDLQNIAFVHVKRNLYLNLIPLAIAGLWYFQMSKLQSVVWFIMIILSTLVQLSTMSMDHESRSNFKLLEDPEPYGILTPLGRHAIMLALKDSAIEEHNV